VSILIQNGWVKNVRRKSTRPSYRGCRANWPAGKKACQKKGGTKIWLREGTRKKGRGADQKGGGGSKLSRGRWIKAKGIFDGKQEKKKATNRWDAIKGLVPFQGGDPGGKSLFFTDGTVNRWGVLPMGSDRNVWKKNRKRDMAKEKGIKENTKKSVGAESMAARGGKPRKMCQLKGGSGLRARGIYRLEAFQK